MIVFNTFLNVAKTPTSLYLSAVRKELNRCGLGLGGSDFKRDLRIAGRCG
jgi:hypothetical protein